MKFSIINKFPEMHTLLSILKGGLIDFVTFFCTYIFLLRIGTVFN